MGDMADYYGAYDGETYEDSIAFWQQSQNLLKDCPVCKAPMEISKKGNNYCSKKCWLKEP